MRLLIKFRELWMLVRGLYWPWLLLLLMLLLLLLLLLMFLLPWLPLSCCCHLFTHTHKQTPIVACIGHGGTKLKSRVHKSQQQWREKNVTVCVQQPWNSNRKAATTAPATATATARARATATTTTATATAPATTTATAIATAAAVAPSSLCLVSLQCG